MGAQEYFSSIDKEQPQEEAFGSKLRSIKGQERPGEDHQRLKACHGGVLRPLVSSGICSRHLQHCPYLMLWCVWRVWTGDCSSGGHVMSVRDALYGVAHCCTPSGD